MQIPRLDIPWRKIPWNVYFCIGRLYVLPSLCSIRCFVQFDSAYVMFLWFFFDDFGYRNGGVSWWLDVHSLYPPVLRKAEDKKTKYTLVTVREGSVWNVMEGFCERYQREGETRENIKSPCLRGRINYTQGQGYVLKPWALDWLIIVEECLARQIVRRCLSTMKSRDSDQSNDYEYGWKGGESLYSYMRSKDSMIPAVLRDFSS